MKKRLLYAVIALCAFLFSCENTLFEMPRTVKGNGNTSTVKPPENISATHGGRRAITLKWDEAQGAVRYHMFRAENPLGNFEQCGETTATEYTFTVAPGAVVYYKVAAVSWGGTVSSQSQYVFGSSLAQPLISDITDITENSVNVTWYMENALDSTYKKDLLYTVYCFNGATEVAQIPLDGASLAENRATIKGLNAYTTYKYQVEAYLRGDQSSPEKSELMDARTARRLRPGAPVNLAAAHGRAKDKIELSFKLPEMVDVASGPDVYQPHPVYFVISRRLYSESGDNEYQKLCAYFGSLPDKAAELGGSAFPEYAFDATVTWTDTGVNRAEKYEYKVQSYVDNLPNGKTPGTSDMSIANTTGWALSEGEIVLDDPVYTPNESEDAYAHANFSLRFNFDPRGETYKYTLMEKIEQIGDAHPNDPSGDILNTIPGSLSDGNPLSYTAEMDLGKQTSETARGRGIYSYTVNVLLEDGETVVDTVTAIGSIQISEDMNLPVVESFTVTDGYTDKFVISWKGSANTKFVLKESDDSTNWTDVTTVDWSGDPPPQGVYEASAAPGVTRYFSMQPLRDDGGTDKFGQTVFSPAVRTMGKPEQLTVTGASYSTITVNWKAAQKADTYRIKYKYTQDAAPDWTTSDTVTEGSLGIDAAGNFKYSFKPAGYNDASKAGRELRITVDALNESLREQTGSDVEIASPSEEVTARLVGPAELNLAASKAQSAAEIKVTWKEAPGAGGYYVFRRQFDMEGKFEEGAAAVAYYLPAAGNSGAIAVTGKNLLVDASNVQIDAQTVKATAAFDGGTYTLTDKYLSDIEYAGAYRNYMEAYKNQQNNLIQGYPYRYFVVPVLSDEPLASIAFNYNKDSANKNTAIASYSLGDTSYSGAAALEKHGFAYGFGRNVTAAKGTYSSLDNGVNDKIRVVWNPPPLFAESGVTPQYDVYRKAYDKNNWEKMISVDTPEYIDSMPEPGVAYEYLIGISGSEPGSSERFIDLSRNQRDEKSRALMLGYKLDMVKIVEVSRDERKKDVEFAEQLVMQSTGVKNAGSSDKNWGIDGYTVFVMNRNIDAQWHEIADISGSALPDQTNQTVDLTNSGGLLKVLRDYRHYYKVRSYVNTEDGKIYCEDPVPAGTWTAGMDTDYVKWGARQISAEEFIKITTLYMADGLQMVNGNAWNTAYPGFPVYAARTSNADGDGASGSIRVESNFGVSSWDIQFSKFRTDLQTKAGDWMTFLTLNGWLWAGTYASNQYPHHYGGNWNQHFVDVSGPADTPGLYTGKMKIGEGSGDMSWDGGIVHIVYPAGTAEQHIPFRGQDTPLPYTGKGNERYQQDAWR